ncbi:MAG: hypothetical protein ACOYLF_17810 [Blastocatellia bacterium]|jgi:hypothetical protein
MDQNRRYQGVIAVVIRQYGTGLYRSYVSLSRETSICLGTHADEKGATDRLDRFWQAYDEGSIRNPEDLSGLIDASSSNADPLPITPPGVVREC